MKKSVMLMVGILAVALAGSAQAAGNVMFAVQSSGGIDKTTISDIGDILTAGNFGSGLQLAPGSTPLTGPVGVFHVASEGNASNAPAFLAQHVAFPTTAGGSSFFTGTAPNFSFYRINRKDDGTYVLPMAGNALGYFNFGSLNTTQDPNLGGRNNIAAMYVRAESTWSSLTDTPTYFWWASTSVGGAFVERMRLSSAGNLGIGVTTTPTSKLQVVGLPYYASNAAALTAGLTAGAFYKCGGTVALVAPTDTASQTLCVVY